jgi:hypothetical protein
MPHERPRPGLGLKQTSPDPGDEETGAVSLEKIAAPGLRVTTRTGVAKCGRGLKIHRPGVQVPLPPSMCSIAAFGKSGYRPALGRTEHE